MPEKRSPPSHNAYSRCPGYVLDQILEVLKLAQRPAYLVAGTGWKGATWIVWDRLCEAKESQAARTLSILSFRVLSKADTICRL